MSSPGVSQGKLFLGGEKKDLGMLCRFEEGEAASGAVCLCDVKHTKTYINVFPMVGVTFPNRYLSLK